MSRRCRREKLQAPKTACAQFGISYLGFLWNLVLGIWCFASAHRRRFSMPRDLRARVVSSRHGEPAAGQAVSESKFFTDGTNARPLPSHVVARGDVREDEAFN